MLFGQLFHIALRTGDLDATVRFYTDVLGLIVAEIGRASCRERVLLMV